MQLDYLIALSTQAKQRHHRFGIELIGSQEWSLELIEQFLQHEGRTNTYKLGGEAVTWAKPFPKNGGAQILGHDVDCVVYDAIDGLDANSLTASAGTIVGGGALIVINRHSRESHSGHRTGQNEPGQQWLDTCFSKTNQISEDGFPSNPVSQDKRHLKDKTAALATITLTEGEAKEPTSIDYSDQQESIARICKVVEGHRKRPFVLTADRGRGKSASLGLAAALLMKKRDMSILVTAPSPKSVNTLFKHAELNLEGAVRTKHQLTYRNSSIQFVAPDELLSSRPSCDLLLVDEAAAIPVPMLKEITAQYHRLVFSSTVHGYEGCGRGFTIRFLPWLEKARPGTHTLHMSHPMRWAKNDPLENWLFDSFLLNAELPKLATGNSNCLPEFRLITQKELLSDTELLRTCFSLLVNAHYQTSPNDLLHLLSDGSVVLYGAFKLGKCVACITTVKEGRLEADVIDDVAIGKRRPKGHLVPTTIVNHLGYSEVGKFHCHRVMRIAVHPLLQRQGIGSQFIGWLVSDVESDDAYVATSFGANSYLLDFWIQCGFQPIWLGSSKDQASGCFSVLMVHIASQTPHRWAMECQAYWLQQFVVLLASTYRNLDAGIVTRLLNFATSTPLTDRELNHLRNYVSGGASMDSIIAIGRKLLLNANTLHDQAPLTVAFFQLQDWSYLCSHFGFSGRKQAELEIRKSLSELLSQFTV
ncbi:GNAT family N-acetyltransferase [Vibrio tapetis]|uniref:tRNA(Met) cytidine acetyltransferase TmcA n=1 Tax=Vibrio tapetis subsp. tapetis TaxID=1671868 RepID=A0A2N8ZK18_9VIBR|nr:GNAT family N-acetyltransferase [Vibrio tapetis]SON52245.1 tRNA(Met) cytidine acetyltransferase TmcA [Vibrio tapetis subsp. tapetis]